MSCGMQFVTYSCDWVCMKTNIDTKAQSDCRPKHEENVTINRYLVVWAMRV